MVVLITKDLSEDMKQIEHFLVPIAGAQISAL
jgi:hypothetical protein